MIHTVFCETMFVGKVWQNMEMFIQRVSLTYYLMVAKVNCYFFKGRYASAITSEVAGEIVDISDNAVHLGHDISTSDCDSMISAAKRAFWNSYNIFVSNFGHLYSLLKISVFAPFCCSFYGSPLTIVAVQ